MRYGPRAGVAAAPAGAAARGSPGATSDGTASSARGFFGREGNRGDGSGGGGGGGGRAGRLLLAWQKGNSPPRCTESGAAADPAWSGVHTLLASAALLATERLAVIFEVQLERFFLFSLHAHICIIYIYIYIYFIYIYIYLYLLFFVPVKNSKSQREAFFFLHCRCGSSKATVLFSSSTLAGCSGERHAHTHARATLLCAEEERNGVLLRRG